MRSAETRIKQKLSPKKDILLIYPLVTNQSVLLNTIYALYYLPDHYKLIVGGGETTSALLSALDADVKKRISFMEASELQATSSGRIIIYDQTETTSTFRSALLPLSTITDTDDLLSVNRISQIATRDKPAALASAILKSAGN